jgi:hypothetical protein
MAKIDLDLTLTENNETPDTNIKKNDNNDSENENIEITQEEITKNVEIERMKWKTRRKMAWLALIAEVAVTIALFVAPIPENRLTILSEPITWFYFSMTSVIGFYMGATTWAYLGGKKNKY